MYKSEEECLYHIVALSMIKNQKTSVGEDVEKRKPLCTVDGIVKLYSHCGKEYDVSSEKLKIILPYDPTIPLLDIYPKELEAESQRDICTPMFIAALFTIGKMWKQSHCPSMDEWMNKMWYIRAMEYYSVLKRKEILQYATIWMNLEDIMLSEISRS